MKTKTLSQVFHGIHGKPQGNEKVSSRRSNKAPRKGKSNTRGSFIRAFDFIRNPDCGSSVFLSPIHSYF
jgi:hypothetical protein